MNELNLLNQLIAEMDYSEMHHSGMDFWCDLASGMMYSVIPERAVLSDLQFDAGLQKESFPSGSHCTGVRQVNNVLLLDHESRKYLNFGQR